MTEKYQPIPHRLKNMAVGGHVAGAEDIDAGNGKTQQDINADTYRKNETYSKEQLNNMITTPEQEYLSVTATAETTSVDDIATLIAIKYPDGKESADTVYRVGCWDGEQYDTGVYTEYVWDGTQYIPVGVKNPGIDEVPTDGSSNLIESGGTYNFVKEETIEELLDNTLTDENDKYYITDKQKVVLGYIDKATGALTWLTKDEEQQHIADIVSRASEEIDVEGYDGYRFITDNNYVVIGYIAPDGSVFFYNLKNNGGGSSERGSDIDFMMNVVANSGKGKKALNILNNLSKGTYSINGYTYNTTPFISFHDDDAHDYQIPVSGTYGATPETRVPITSKGTGYASFLYVFFKSISERHKTDLNGKLVATIAAEGQRIGLIDNVYSDTDSFDGKLNFAGEMAAKLHYKAGWDIIAHSMTARYISNSYQVASLDDPLVAEIEQAATYKGQNYHSNSYIHCLDSNLDYEYRNGEWHEVSDHYIRPYLAESLDANAPLIFNPRYSNSYQWAEWKKRAIAAGLPFLDASVFPGSSPCRKFIIETMDFFKTPFLGQGSYLNTQPLNQTCIRRQNYHPASNNAWDNTHYAKLLKQVDACIEGNRWLVFTSHANDPCNRNYYVDGVDYGERRDDNYPQEWIVPLKQEELEAIDENNYWEVPPARLGINSWAEWYPCPGTTYDMFMNVIEYAISKGVEFGSTEEGINRFGNAFSIGLDYPQETAAEKRLAASEKDPTWYNYIVVNDDGSIKYNVR